MSNVCNNITCMFFDLVAPAVLSLRPTMRKANSSVYRYQKFKLFLFLLNLQWNPLKLSSKKCIHVFFLFFIADYFQA